MKLGENIYIVCVLSGLAALTVVFVSGNVAATVGLAFFLYGCGTTFQNLRARLRWQKAMGRITELDFKNERMIFVYEVDGQKLEGKSGQDASYHRVGQEIDIRYDPLNPEATRHVSPTVDLFGWSTIVLGLALVWLSITG